MVEPIDIDQQLAMPKTYEDAILKIYDKRSQRGQAFAEVGSGVTYFDTVTQRKTLAKAIAESVAEGHYETHPVELWTLETKGKSRSAHLPEFTDHVIGSALYQLISHNARCYGLPGVYSYLPGMTNAGAMRDLGSFIRQHRKSMGTSHFQLYVLQSDFEHYGDNLPLGPGAALWPILRRVVTLGSPSGEISENSWNLITALARPNVLDEEGAQFNRLRGVAMGTPLVPVLANLAVLPMDRAILETDGIFYARYNDDFLLAHPDLAALQEADARIDSLLEELGVKRKASKEVRTALSAHGLPAKENPAYLGRNRIDYLGLSVSHTGALTVGPHRLQRFVSRVATRLDGSAPALSQLPVEERARQLVATTNVMLDLANQFAVPGLQSLLDTTTDRGVLKDLDFRIARKIVQVATGRPGVRGFRGLPPAKLHGEMGLTSLVALKNLR